MRRAVFLFSAVLITSFPGVLFGDSILLLMPNGGEKLVAGSSYDITWQTEGTIQNVSMEYSTNNGGVWNDINTVPNSGSYEWTVPQKNSPQCLVRISDANNPDVNNISDAMFRIYICTLSYDLNHDCIVNLLDLALLASEYLQSGDPVPETMVLIPGGEFQMGDHHDGMSDALPVHAVYVDSFYMSRYKITSQQYCDYLNSAISEGLIEVRSGIVYAAPGGTDPYCNTHSYTVQSQIDYSGGVFSVRTNDGIDMSDHPVFHVSWYGAVAYCNYYGHRLPTEAEWEYAARGGGHDPYYRYPWGDSIDGSKANYSASGDPYETGAKPWTTPVGYYDGGQIPAGTDMANGYGLYDMAGNVWEWCNDWYGENYYSVSPYDNPEGPVSGTYRVLRGGQWNSGAVSCRVASRDGYNLPNYRCYCRGFRVVLDIALSPSASVHTDISAQQVRELIDSKDQLIVVDVRELYEYCDAVGHIPGAVNYPWSSGVLQQSYPELPVDSPVLVVCRLGQRSNHAATFLDSKGYLHVYDMLGGMGAWQWETVLCVDSDNDGLNDGP